MDLTVLGSGTSIPLSYRASPSLSVRIGREIILFDLGPGTLRQLTRVGIPHDSIGRIFITHFHPDHTSDLIHLLFVTKNPSIVKNRLPFVISGPRGTKRLIADLQEAYHPWLTLPTEIMRIEELNFDDVLEKDYGGYKVTVRHTAHSSESIGYRVQDSDGKSLVYSGDTGFCREVIDLARRADLLILESSFPEGSIDEGHLTPFQAGRIATLAGAKKLLLTHFYPECLAADITAQCRKSYGGELVLGSDLLCISI